MLAEYLSDYHLKNFNFRLAVYVLALNGIGLLVIKSAEAGEGGYMSRQMIGLFGGVIMALILSLINYRLYMRLNGIVYIGCIAILLAVIIAGSLGGFGGGSRRWIVLPVIGRFQPSEFVKIGLILFFSWYLSKYQEKISRLKTLICLAGLASVPMFLILEQPDLSTNIVIAFTILCLIFVAGISYRWILGAMAVAIPSLGLILFLAENNMLTFLEPYQVNRILAFMNPAKYADLNLQQNNSKMAIGSGQLYGKGLFNDTSVSVKSGNFLSEEHTDFIFSVIGEELGFVGSMLVILLYVLFVYECLRMASRAKDMAGRLICTGVAALVGFQSFANIAVATGVFPNTGLTLPFISYGVSSLVSLYIGVGIVLNVGLQQRTLEF